jgi:hypothetical protein
MHLADGEVIAVAGFHVGPLGTFGADVEPEQEGHLRRGGAELARGAARHAWG